jgi:hypothetical protein
MPTACPAEVDFFLAQTDAAAMGDHDSFVVERIVEIRQSGVPPLKPPTSPVGGYSARIYLHMHPGFTP